MFNYLFEKLCYSNIYNHNFINTDMKVIRVVNLFLLVTLIVLLFHSEGQVGMITGSVIYELDKTEPTCTFHNEGEFTKPAWECCYEIQAAQRCVKEGTEFTCGKYTVNSKQLQFCLKEGYDVTT